jgi:murein DD-endopeptidase MepM/ murein hydrolase activator NlpD
MRISPLVPRLTLALAVLAATVAVAPAAAARQPPSVTTPQPASVASAASEPVWDWPARGVISRQYVQPVHDYAAGHRGIDILAMDRTVRAPDDGEIAFAGTVADRSIVTITHADGIVSTLEPVVSTLTPGTTVGRGDPVGLLAEGGHARAGELHLGARQDGEYLNPLRLLGQVPRAVLLPCC